MNSIAFAMPVDILLGTLLEHSGEIMLIVDPKSQQIVGFNPAACMALGYSPPELTGLNILDIECSIHDVFYWDEVAVGTPRDLMRVEGLYRCKNGNVIPIKKNIKTIDCRGRPLLVLVARDISDRKNIEELLAEKTSQLAATLEATADGVCVVDLDGHIRNFNRRFVDIWSIPDVLLEGHHDQGILAFMAEQVKHSDAYLKRLGEIESDPTGEAFDAVELKDGRIFERGAKPMYLAEQPVGRVYSFSDVTDRIRAEREANYARDTAQKASQAKSDFLSQMSHELRTPLNAILGFTQLLEAEAPPEHIEMVKHIASAGWHLLDLINDVLDLAKIEAGRLDIYLQAVNAGEIIRDCMALTKPLAEKNAIRLEIKEGLDCSISADGLRFKQVIINILSNAIKYNRYNGSVTVEMRHSGENLRISITDTGIGMTPDELEQLFTPFTRVGNSKHNIEGTGIGLCLTRELVRIMRGTIEVSSTPGVGSTFVIEFPTIATTVKPAPTEAGPTLQLCPGSMRHVLYVEDDPVSILLMQEVFKRIPGTRLITATDPKEGLTLSESVPLSLILLDVNLPVMSGLELVREFRRRPDTRRLKIFAFSANALPSDVEKGLAAGFDMYLTKPLQLNILTEKLRQALCDEASPTSG